MKLSIKEMEKFLTSKYGYKKYRKKIVSEKADFELFFDRGLGLYAIKKLNDDGWRLVEGPLENILIKLNWPDDIKMVKIEKRKKH